MELINYLKEQEGKTLEFKQNCYSLVKIVKTVVAFANTAGGVLLIGVKDKSKDIVGIEDPLKDEERLSNAFADSISPLMIPDIGIVPFRDKNLIMITVHHSFGPYYIRSEGSEGVYIRLGSTNRKADSDTIESIKRSARNVAFDEQPYPEINSEAIDFRVASELFSKQSRTIDIIALKTLGILISQGNTAVPSIGGVLLFGINRGNYFPDSIIRCARFAGTNSAQFTDQLDIDEYLPIAVESVIAFIQKHTNIALEIGSIRSKEVPEYPIKAIREAVINSLVHADYSIKGMNIKVAIFDDRIEITNPGALPYGLTLKTALSGISKLRNRVIGRVFRDLSLIEQWGTGMNRIIQECEVHKLRPPLFEEIGTAFRVTLYSGVKIMQELTVWQKQLLEHLSCNREISTKEAAQFWKKSERTARTRLLSMLEKELIIEIRTSPTDPKKVYVLKSQSPNV